MNTVSFELLLRVRLAGARERIRAAIGPTTFAVDPDAHAERVYREVERAHRTALAKFVHEAGGPK